MTQQEFISLTEREVFAEMLRNINELFGQSKSASLFISLFSSVRCKIVLEQYNDLSIAAKKMQLDDLVNSVTTNMEGNDIVFRFFYKDEKHLKHLHKVSVKYHMYFTYQYFKHVHSLMSLTTSSAHQAAMFRLVANKEHPFYLIDIANTYAINKQIHRMLTVLSTEKTKRWNEVKELIELYYNSDLITQADILADLAKHNLDLVIKPAVGKYVQVITPDLTYITEPKVPAEENPDFSGAQSIEEQDRSLVAVANQLIHSISTSTKGTSIGELYQTVFDEIKVDVLWFDKIKKNLTTQIFNKTASGYTSWENLSSTYRHIYKAPISKSEDKKVKFIISIDNSGSFHTEDLQKIFGIMKNKSKQIAEIHVLHHTSDVIAQFHLKHAQDIQLDKMFKTALGCRHGSGGTSHAAVFKAIQDLTLRDPDQWIYISVSDNYSDIESVLPKYPVMAKVSKIWVKASDGRDLNSNLVPGLQVALP